MPKRSRSRYASKSRRRSRSGKRRRLSSRVPRNAVSSRYATGPFPAKYRAKLILATVSSLDPAADRVADSVICSANGMYEPFSGSALQPMGFDELMNMYDHYYVKYAVLTVATGAWGDVQLAVHVHDDSTPITDADRIREFKNTKCRLLPRATGHGQTIIRYPLNISKFLGQKDYSLRRGTSAINPIEECWFHISAMGITTADPSSFPIAIKLVFYAEFTEPKGLSRS